MDLLLAAMIGLFMVVKLVPAAGGHLFMFPEPLLLVRPSLVSETPRESRRSFMFLDTAAPRPTGANIVRRSAERL
ncbi:hypothetical protein BBta_p0200 (plasmid) [Bradyrhizobium sp. BTAi1]|nr:hypothetical protein BBta_p0200 [Bradyrhizobium sp. BTAi1]